VTRALLAIVVLAWAAPGASAATVSTVGVVKYAAAPGEANRLEVSGAPGGALAFRDAGATIAPGPGCAEASPGAVTCTASGIAAVEIDLGDGDDVLAIHAGNVTATLGPGDDRATADGGGLLVHGGPGADVFAARRDVRVEVAYLDHVVGVRVTLDGRADDGAPGEGDDVGPDVRAVTGSAHRDVLDARRARGIVALSGGPGADRLYAAPAGGGLEGGFGDDVLRGGPGRDLIGGEEGDDVLSGGGGDDSLSGDPGRNVATGGTGHDRFWLGSLSSDVIHARDGARDTVTCPWLPRRLEVDAADRLTECAVPPAVALDAPRLLAGGRLPLALSCPRSAPGGCRGRVRLTDTHPHPLARVRFAVAAGRRARLTVRLDHSPRHGMLIAVVVARRARPPASSRTTVTSLWFAPP
jgi:hypothetical protein